MSVVGDIIDDLTIRPKIGVGAITGIFGALAVGVFIVIGLSGGKAIADADEARVSGSAKTKTITVIAGGAQRGA